MTRLLALVARDLQVDARDLALSLLVAPLLLAGLLAGLALIVVTVPA